MTWKRDNVWAFLVIHLLAGLALLPRFFSWTGVGMLAAGFLVFGVLGINLGYHRLLAHRSFSCPRWLEHGLVLLAVCSVQDSPPHWVAVHRRHHQAADAEADPHSPRAGFFWAHIGWLLARRDDMRRGPLIEQYAPDILRDPLYAWIDRRNNWMKLALLSWLATFGVGFGSALPSATGVADALQAGLGILIWGAILRTVVVWHVTWSVNSAAHLWGYRSHPTPDLSRNNVVVGLLAAGEGWHNNHHAAPRSARHGHRWWELDLTWLVIRILLALGLARDVVLPPSRPRKT